MSTVIKITDIPYDQREDIVNECKIVPAKTDYGKEDPYDVYDIYKDEYVIIPFAYYFKKFNEFPNKDIKFDETKIPYTLKLFDRQTEILEETLDILYKNRSILLSLYTGFGKSYYALYLTSLLGGKCCIIIHREILVGQWVKSIKTSMPKAIVQYVKSSEELDPFADYYIINVINVPKRSREFYEDITVLIVDEAHTICSNSFCKSLNYFTPKYSIACTATPKRKDGKDKVLSLYFGDSTVYRPLKALFNVYIVKTNFTPEIKENASGKLDWHTVLESQAKDEKRNKLIVDLCCFFSKRTILILCKRKDHAKLLHKEFSDRGEDADVYAGSTKYVNYSCRILIVTYSKGGVGFDHPKLDTLICAGDVEEMYLQYLGRVFRVEYNYPIILDFRDKFFPLYKHQKTRLAVCKEAQGEIKDFSESFPLFNHFYPEYA